MSLDVNISEPDEFNCTELHSCIENVAKLNNINDFTYHVEFACGKGENFIANVFRVEIKDTVDCDRKISVIIKTLVNTTRQELFRQLHKREVKAYEEVLSKFEILQSKLDVTNRIVLPGCILSDMKRGNEVLILEDLVSKGYEYETKVNKLKNLEYEQVCLVLRNLAKFHALSIVFELNDKENFIKLKCEFKDVLYQEMFRVSKLRNYYTNCYEDSIQLLDDLEARTKLQYVETKLMQLLRYYTSPRTFNVLCHGDCWINNFLFKQKDNITTDLCFLDFQAMRYSNPATDLVYFLFLSTDSTFRCKYMKDILSVYYESFTTFLKLYDIDSNSVYTKDSFEVDVQEMLPFGVLITLIESRIVTTFEDKEISESTLNLDQCISNESNEEMLLKIRLDDVVKESVLNGTLDRLCEQMKLLN